MSMDTAKLIEALKADAGRQPAPMARVWTIAAVVAIVIAAVVFFSALGMRPDFDAAAETMRFQFKFVVTLALLVTAGAALFALARPGAGTWRMWLLLLAPALVITAAIVEMMVMPADTMRARWMGTNSMVCLSFIPLIGLGPLAAFLVGLRHGAPTRPALAGAVAGLVAGGLAATLYAAHCIDDSPMFVATWYTLAIAILAVLGAIGGRLFARW
jgi:hypothetical protein